MRLDPLSLVLGLPALASFGFAAFGARASRISAAEPRSLFDAFPTYGPALFAGAIVLIVAMCLARKPPLRLALSLAALLATLLIAGLGTTVIGADLGQYGRVSIGPALWIWLSVTALWMADSLTRSGASEVFRLCIGLGLIGVVAALAATGLFDNISVVAEYHARARTFLREVNTHLFLTFGAFAAALLIGIPLGLFLHMRTRWRGVTLGALTAVQTVPSIALFGLMILPLGWMANNLPLAAALGIKGIGFAPAFMALTLYALLPIVANTVSGLQAVSPSVQDAARAMGMTDRQRLWQVDVPLALPVILTGARIVLVQSIGLATVGALIGAGGLGTFVFQGLAQGAMDLVLLGALPTVILAAIIAKIFDVLIVFTAKVPS